MNESADTEPIVEVPALGPPVRIRPRDVWELRGFRLLYSGLRRIPLSTGLRVGAGIGSLLFHIDRKRRRTALKNLRLAFPGRSDAELLEILRRSCRNLGRMGAEVCHLESLRPETVERLVHLGTPAEWERLLSLGRERGAIILTAHFGNWELLAYAASLLGAPITLVHRPMRNPLVDRDVVAIRCRSGTRSLPKKSAARDILRALQRHELIAVPADQNQTQSYGVFVDFFGKPACTTAGPARLAALTGAPIYPVFLVREGEGPRHRMVVFPRVEIVRTTDKHADLIENTQRCTAVIEEMIRSYPDQWIWFHKRWRTRPEGEAPFY